MVQHLSSHLLQLSAPDRILFANDVEKLDTKLMPASSVVQTPPPPSLRRNMNQFNVLHGDEPNEPPREWIRKPPAAHFKFRTSTSNTNLVVSAIMGRLNHHAIYNGDVKVHTSNFPVEFNSESVTDPDTTTIKSIDDNKIDHILELFHS